MEPVKIKLNDHYKGDHWVGMTVGPVLINGAQPISNLAAVTLEFRDENDQLGHKFDSAPGAGEGTIVIDDAVTWEASIAPQALDLDAGPLDLRLSNSKTWYWDFKTTDATGKIITLYRGTIKVSEDVSV